MSTVITIELDIAKSVFQVHGISATGEVLIRRQVRPGQVLKVFASLPPCRCRSRLSLGPSSASIFG
jgi:transposase